MIFHPFPNKTKLSGFVTPRWQQVAIFNEKKNNQKETQHIQIFSYNPCKHPVKPMFWQKTRSGNLPFYREEQYGHHLFFLTTVEKVKSERGYNAVMMDRLTGKLNLHSLSFSEPMCRFQNKHDNFP